MHNGNCDYHVFLQNISSAKVERILLRYFRLNATYIAELQRDLKHNGC